MSPSGREFLQHILDEAEGNFGVDYELVWDVVQTKIPTLRSRLRTVLT